MHDDPDAKVAQVHAALVARGLVQPLSSELAETASWMDHDLRSLAENRLGVAAGSGPIAAQEREDWARRATEDGRQYGPHSRFETPYWLLDGERRVGTITLATGTLGSRSLRVSSLYVRPADRGTGIARRALRALHEATRCAGLSGIGLETEWSWSCAVRFYCKLGMWVRMWKRSLVWVWRDDLPAWSVEWDGSSARFFVQPDADSPPELLIEAEHRGERLGWHETRRSPHGEVSYTAPGTFAVALALRGWPLITSDQEWREQQDCGFSDAGGPVGLAFKIRRWEAWDRSKGWQVDAPRVPGLDYPTWDELEAEAEARRAARAR